MAGVNKTQCWYNTKKVDFARPFPAEALRRYINLLPQLIEAAQGIKKANLVIRNVDLVDVTTSTIAENMSIVVYSGFIVALINSKKDSIYIGNDTNVIDMQGLYAAPGFIDAHVHIESSLLNLNNFSKIALNHGVTLAVVDPHEITNVGGIDYLYTFALESMYQPLKILLQIPCCIPPTSIDVDVASSVIDLDDFRKLIGSGYFHSVGEFMDVVGVITRNSDALHKIKLALELGLIVYGHVPVKDDVQLNAYTVSGASSCHESTDVLEVISKLQRGLWIMLRYATAWRDAESVLPKMIKQGIDLSRVMIVTDDISVIDLVEHGYLDYVVRRIIELGLDPIKAIKMVTLTPATYLKLDHLVGVVAPGRLADIVLLRNLSRVEVDTVFVEGTPVYYKGNIILEFNNESQTSKLESPFNIPHIESAEDMIITVSSRYNEITAIAAEVVPGTPLTRKITVEIPVVNGIPLASNDILYVAVVDRYLGKYVGRGFVKGINLTSGAIAQTVGHDTHNVIVVGSNANLMFKALRELEKIRGGIIAVDDRGTIVCRLHLDIAGLMSSKNIDHVYREAKCVENFYLERGVSDPKSAHMYISLLTLPVIPEIRITPKGVVDVIQGKIVDPVVAVR